MKERITIYTTKKCSYCTAVRTILQREGYPYSDVDVADPNLRVMLVKKSQGSKSVPQIFIGDLHVGGFEELNTMYRSGELNELMSV